VALLKNEADIMKHIKSDHYPDIYNYDIDYMLNRGYLAMEFIDGKPLDDYCEEIGKVSEDEAWGLTKQIIKAVAFLHSKGVVHRDIKPQNILVTSDGVIKLIDFNISKQSMNLINKDVTSACKFYGKFFTQVSSPLFAAPEISSVDFYTESIDIWGIGVSYLILLCGMSKFSSRVNAKSNSELFEDFKDELSHCSDQTKSLMSKLLSNDANDRPSIDELLSLCG
jgi:serine/threonine protein kinase